MSELYVCCFDLHFPRHHAPTWNAILDFTKKRKPAGFIFGGDQFDNDTISHHNSKKPILWKEGSYKAETEGFDKEILKPLEVALGTAKKTWMIGNHDEWEHQWVERFPQWAGFERPDLLNLKARGWKVAANTVPVKLGRLVVIHGDQFAGYAPANLAKRAVESYTCSVLQGHNHTMQVYTRVSPVDHTQKWAGYVSPCACELNAAFMKNKPSSWVNGFTIVEVMKDKTFNVYPIVVTNGKFSFGGVEYGKT